MLSWLVGDEALLRAARKIVEYVAPLLESRLAVRLWDGSRLALGSGEPGPLTIAVHAPGVIGSLLRRPTLANFIALYAAGRIEFQGGDLTAFGDALRVERPGRRLGGANRWFLLRQAWPFLLRAADRPAVGHAVPESQAARHGPGRDGAEFIRFHYDDIPTEVYKLFLDAELVYSCGYFTDPDGGLDQAQQDKLEMICRKLRLRPGERFLDIGCGWGGLLCHAARHHGVLAHGVTLARQQFDYAAEKVRRMGLEGRVTVQLADYSDLKGTYDKIASVGMMEHVGIANYPAYFGKLHSLLSDRGVLLNHSIARGAKKSAAAFRKARAEQRLIQKYIFPGGELDHIGHTVEVMEGCRFEVHDVEGWRPHYARTLRLWCQRLSARRGEAVRLVGEEIYRLWVMYLATFSFAFESGSLRIFQTVATKQAKGLSPLPLTRGDLYAPPSAAAAGEAA